MKNEDFPAEPDKNLLGTEAAVVVLGDVGRSPRMCNHAKMLADAGYSVKIFGFYDSIPGEQIVGHKRIRIIGIPPPPEMKSLPPALQLPAKLIWNFFTLLFVLNFTTSLNNLRLILMQNPPGLPTMFICYLTAKLKSATFTIDWHNYMYSILRDKYELKEERVFGNGSKTVKEKIVRSVAFLEGLCGRLSDRNLCVTEAMRDDLQQRWTIKADTFYDRPPSWKFKQTSLSEIHELYTKLSESEHVLRGKQNDETVITRITSSGEAELLPNRPLVLLSSTSWTPDEKFEILLDALVLYDEKCKLSKNLPRILMIITGKGPLKESYLEEILAKNLRSIDVLTPWLEADDYPKILASADIGISLHTSTSGLDLPMKVVDMFGAEVPVLAKRFKCIHELVQEGVNGHLFDTSEQLAEQITVLSTGFPMNCQALNGLTENVKTADFLHWETTWWQRAARQGGLVPSEKPMTAEKRKIVFGLLMLIVLFFKLGSTFL